MSGRRVGRVSTAFMRGQDSLGPFVETADSPRAEVHRPESVIDLFEADVLPAQDVSRIHGQRPTRSLRSAPRAAGRTARDARSAAPLSGGAGSRGRGCRPGNLAECFMGGVRRCTRGRTPRTGVVGPRSTRREGGAKRWIAAVLGLEPRSVRRYLKVAGDAGLQATSARDQLSDAQHEPPSGGGICPPRLHPGLYTA